VGLTGDDDEVDDDVSGEDNGDWMFQTFLKNKKKKIIEEEAKLDEGMDIPDDDEFQGVFSQQKYLEKLR
jgi:hypothetical protein